MLRYSDVLLMYAEAQNQADGSPSVESIGYVNDVRRRAKADEVNITDPQDFQRLIEDERQYLLIYATNGATSDRYQWLPIPTRELGLNNLLQQNQAWR